MAPVFASPDIAAIVAAFPPPLPTSKTDSLVRSTSGERLFTSAGLQRSFRRLRRDSLTRIVISQLAGILGIRDTSWLLTENDEDLVYNLAKDSILPDSEVRFILEDLSANTNELWVAAQDLVLRKDLALDSLLLVLKRHGASHDLLTLESASSGSHDFWIYSPQLISRMDSRLSDLIREDSNDKVDLSNSLGNVPYVVLKKRAEEFTQASSVAGSIEANQGHVYFVPHGYLSAQEVKQNAELQRIADSAVAEIETGSGFYLCGPGDSVFQDRLVARLDDSTVARNLLGDSSMLFARTDSLNGMLRRLEDRARNLLATTWRSSAQKVPAATLDEETVSELAGRDPQTEYAKLVLSLAQYRRAIELVMAEKAEELEAADRLVFTTSVSLDIAAPVQLYSSGMRAADDAILKQHLDEFLVDYLRREHLVPALQRLREQMLLRERSRAKDADKFQLACREARTVAEFEDAITRFMRKQKTAPPSNSILDDSRRDYLQQKLKAMRKMTRGSDLLQNLIWLALAQSTGALFVSSGKDTSRMVKFYQRVGDAAVGEKLGMWRDKLKAGKEEPTDLEGMRALAAEIVDNPIRQ